MRFPFFGLLNTRSPFDGLMEHYELIAKGMEIIERSMTVFVDEGSNFTREEFKDLLAEVNEVEDHADKVKRNIRNHMPRGLVTSVDQMLFFNYTRQQDDILDAGQDSLFWISMRALTIPQQFQRKLVNYIKLVSRSIKLLRPALEITSHLLTGTSTDREEAKDFYRAIRKNHKAVNKIKNDIVPVIFNSSMDFKEIYQLIHFVEGLHDMSHSAEGCVDMLRAMIAR